MAFEYVGCENNTFVHFTFNNIFAYVWQFDYAVRVLHNFSSTNKIVVALVFIHGQVNIENLILCSLSVDIYCECVESL